MSGYEHGSEELTEGQARYYIPTTEQIRKGLLTGYVSDSEFDRWLAGVKADAVRQFVESAIKPEKIKELSDMHLADSVRELQAQAWDEGFDAGEQDVHEHELTHWDDSDCIQNPYREDTE